MGIPAAWVLAWARTLVVTAAAASVAPSAAPSVALKACVDDRPWLPYTTPDQRRPGTMQVRVAKIAADLGVAFASVALPWRRCEEDVRNGKVDALIAAADVPFNREVAEFPLAGGVVDQRRALGVARVVLVRRAGSAVDWDGQSFRGLTTPVGTAAGTQIMIERVRRFGGKVDEGARTDERNLEKLTAKRIDLMAAYDIDLKPLVAGPYAGKVEILPVPLSETAYYLVFSRKFKADHPALVESFWASLDQSAPQRR